MYDVNVMNITFGKKLMSLRPDVLFPQPSRCFRIFGSKLRKKTQIFVESKRFLSLDDTSAILDAIFVYPTVLAT